MPFSRGDVVLINYPDSNLQTYKMRPALIVQADNIQTGLHQRIVAMITSNLGRTGTTRVPIRQNSPEGQQMGLLTDSVVVADNVSTVLEREFARVIGTCPIMDRVDAALKTILGLSSS